MAEHKFIVASRYIESLRHAEKKRYAKDYYQWIRAAWRPKWVPPVGSRWPQHYRGKLRGSVRDGRGPVFRLRLCPVSL